jgi:hypothetical protein
VLLHTSSFAACCPVPPPLHAPELELRWPPEVSRGGTCQQ